MQCPQCGAAIAGSFCEQCGAPAPRAALCRPSGDALVVVVDGGGEGTAVTVDPGDGFVGLLNGDITVIFEPGRHVLPRPCDIGVFVRRARTPVRVTHQTRLRQRGQAADARIFGAASFAVDDPGKLVASMEDVAALADGALEGQLAESVGQRVAESISEALASGEARLESLAEQLAAILPWAANQWALLGTRIDVSGLSISLSPLEADEGEEDEDDGAAGILAPGARVVIALDDGRRVPVIVERLGYLVRLPDGEQAWVAAEVLEQPDDA